MLKKKSQIIQTVGISIFLFFSCVFIFINKKKMCEVFWLLGCLCLEKKKNCEKKNKLVKKNQKQKQSLYFFLFSMPCFICFLEFKKKNIKRKLAINKKKYSGILVTWLFLFFFCIPIFKIIVMVIGVFIYAR